MKLMTKEIEKAFEKQGDTSNKKMEDIKVICKFFNPVGSATWYIYEYNPEDKIAWCFANLGDPTLAECGTVSIEEIQNYKDSNLGLSIERDRHFPVGKYSLREVIDTIKSGGHL